MRKQIYSIVVAAAFTVPSLVNADVKIENVEQNKVIVSYNAREASTVAGRAELEQKIRKAASQVCGPQQVGKAGSLAEYLVNRACFEEAIKNVAEVALVAPSQARADVEIKKVDDNKVVVSYNAEDASTVQGRVELERGIRRAASQVCGPQRLGKAGSLAEYLKNRACFEEAVSKALLKV